MKQTGIKKIVCFVSFKVLHQILFSLIYLNAIENGVFRIGYLIAIVNNDNIEDYINCVPIIVSYEQSILMLPINHLPIPMCNDLEANESKVFFHSTQ